VLADAAPYQTFWAVVLWHLLQRVGRIDIIALMQLELFPFDALSQQERKTIYSTIRQAYWHLRNQRGGRFGQAKARRL
jgi:exosortase/archaeosortase